MKRIVADPAKCLACKACELACAVAHAKAEELLEAIAEGARPRVYIEAAGTFAVPLQCRHCEDAPCVTVCPSGALSRLGEGAPVLADSEKCIGCGFCVQVCPFGVIRFAPSNKTVIKCDLCIKRQGAGRDPACVTACPVGALAFEEVDETPRRRRKRIAVEVCAEEK